MVPSMSAGPFKALQFKPTAEQEAALKTIESFLMESGNRSMSFSGVGGSGKCLALGTEVLLYNGARLPVEDLRPGDKLMGPDSTPREVLTTTRGVGPLYEITPVKGESWICNDAHILTLIETASGEIKDIPLETWLKASESSRLRKNWLQFFVGVTFPKQKEKLPIDPYFLGLWLGDGSKRVVANAEGEYNLECVRVWKPDKQIEETCKKIAKEWGLYVTKIDPNRCPGWHISTFERGKGAQNSLLDALRALLGPKLLIPNSYLTSSRENRLALLAGWLDSDGSNACNVFDIVQKRKDYADAIQFLAKSLGLQATKRIKIVDGEPYWRLCISGETSTIPLKIPRKKASKRRQKKDVRRTSIKIKAVGMGCYAGFTLDGDGRFLLGDFTVTHNTTCLRELGYRLPHLTSSASSSDARLHGGNLSSQLAWSAMTGKAAQRLSSVTGRYARTLHSTLYERPNVDHEQLTFIELQEPKCRILIIDEASMVTPKIYEDLQEWMAQGVKVIFVGDFFQLPPILSKEEENEYGADFSIFKEIPGPMLQKVMRTDNEIVDIATHIREKKVLPRESKGAYTFKVCKDVVQAAVDDYLADPEDHFLITWKNETRMDANNRIRARLGLDGVIQTNEPVLICKNGQGMLNGEVRKVLFAGEGPSIGNVKTYNMQFEGMEEKTVLATTRGKFVMDGVTPFLDKNSWRLYQSELFKLKLPEPLAVSYGYALTAHKAQGSECRRATIFLTRAELISPAFMKPTILPTGERVSFGVRWIYTALSRARDSVSVILDS